MAAGSSARTELAARVAGASGAGSREESKGMNTLLAPGALRPASSKPPGVGVGICPPPVLRGAACGRGRHAPASPILLHTQLFAGLSEGTRFSARPRRARPRPARRRARRRGLLQPLSRRRACKPAADDASHSGGRFRCRAEGGCGSEQVTAAARARAPRRVVAPRPYMASSVLLQAARDALLGEAGSGGALRCLLLHNAREASRRC
jgi:hypothetical protein